MVFIWYFNGIYIGGKGAVIRCVLGGKLKL
jgi:hypothetical protein